MKVLLDTNIVIHREASKVINKSIGFLFRLLDKGKFTKCVHPVTLEEIEKNINTNTVEAFTIKLESYEVLKTITKLTPNVKTVSEKYDINQNDRNDTLLLNEIYSERLDFLITEDRKIHFKAQLLGIDDKVFTIDSFIEKIVTENPELTDYKVLSVKKKRFGEVNLSDSFFDSFKEDYREFEKWYIRKSDDFAYVTLTDNQVTSFLFLKVEDKNENYSNIIPPLTPKKRLKIGTFKITGTGARLSERFMKIIFDNALRTKVEEIYVTIFNKRLEQKMLVSVLEEWGFIYHGEKTTENGVESVYVRNFDPGFNEGDPKITYPYLPSSTRVFLVPIRPEYHTELLPDSLLRTERPEHFKAERPHRNAIKKVYISRSHEKDLKKGDLIIFYRTGGKYKGVITTIGMVENIVLRFKDVNDFIRKCRKRSIFTDSQLKEWWDYYTNLKPFIVNFLYCYSFTKRINLEKLIEMGVISGYDSVPRGFKEISRQKFSDIIRETSTDESIIVD